MRLLVKAALIIGLGIGIQFLLSRHAQEVDDAIFAARAYVWHVRGMSIDDPVVLAACNALSDRTVARLAAAACQDGARQAADSDDLGSAITCAAAPAKQSLPGVEWEVGSLECEPAFTPAD